MSRGSLKAHTLIATHTFQEPVSKVNNKHVQGTLKERQGSMENNRLQAPTPLRGVPSGPKFVVCPQCLAGIAARSVD